MELIYPLIGVEILSREGMRILYADNAERLCYPIIAGIMADYEEQVLITGVKNQRHCSMCKVPPNDRENICRDPPWPARTHADTQAQIRRQRREGLDLKEDS